MKPATHSGHCQSCGRLQKLPGGVLAKHGYTVIGRGDHGYFNGTCSGTDHPPFEQSCDLVKTFIEGAERGLKAVEEQQAELRKPATEPKGWAHIYHAATWKYRHSWYEWRLVEVQRDRFGFPFYVSTDEKDATGPECRIHLYGFGRKNALDDCTEMNMIKADKYLERDAEQLRRYIKWQTERVATWKPMPLLPVEHKDKEGFKLAV